MSVAKLAVEYWDKNPRWGSELNEANRRRIEETLALMPSGVHTVLDVGAGDGTVSNPLVAAGCDVTGVDISSAALRFFAGRAIVARSELLPFSDSSFDLVICAEVLEHLPDGVYERTLSEIERVVSRYVIVTTPNEEYLPAGFTKCGECGAEFHMNQHVRRFSVELHQSLFGSLRPVRTVPIDRWSHSALQTALEQRVFGVFRTPRSLVCPHCHGTSYRSPTLGRTASRLLRLSRGIARRVDGSSKPRWIATLYAADTAGGPEY